MNKKWLWFLLGVAIPCLLNMIFYFELIPSSLSSNSWLSFWGGYLGGIATLAAFFLSNKATKLVILRQWEEKKFVEYKNSLLDNLKLFNTVEILNGISSDMRELVSTVRRIEITANRIEDAVHITNYYTQVTAQNTKALKYIALING